MNETNSRINDNLIVIVGAGPVGLTMALELARYKIPCRIVDQEPGPKTESRAIAIHARTLEGLERCGVSQQLVAEGMRYRQGHIHSHKRLLYSLNFEEIPSTYPFVLGLPQSKTEKILLEQLKHLGITVEYSKEVAAVHQTDDKIQIRCQDGEQLTASYLVGADGAHSVVRKAIELPFSGQSYPQHFYLADVRVHWDLPYNDVCVFLDEKGAMLVLPLDQTGHSRLIFVLFQLNGAQQDELSLAEVERLAAHYGPANMRLSDPTWLTPFRIHHRIVTEYRKGRVLLVGDAAHIHSPVGGQGMNTGMHDAMNLAWKLALVHQQHATPQLLDTYFKERYPIDLSLVQRVDKATRIVTLRNPALQWIRDTGLRILMRRRSVQKWILHRISELSVHYRKSPIVIDSLPRWRGGPRGGDHAPNLPGISYSKERHDLLLFYTDATVEEAMRQRFGQLLEVQRMDTRCAVYRGKKPFLLLVRPDGYIGMSSSTLTTDEVATYFRCLGVVV